MTIKNGEELLKKQKKIKQTNHNNKYLLIILRLLTYINDGFETGIKFHEVLKCYLKLNVSNLNISKNTLTGTKFAYLYVENYMEAKLKIGNRRKSPPFSAENLPH